MDCVCSLGEIHASDASVMWAVLLVLGLSAVSGFVRSLR